jgi:hypothetical protein
MTVTDEMREAGAALIAALRDDLRTVQKAHLLTAESLVRAEDELFALRHFLDERGQLVDDGLCLAFTTLRSTLALVTTERDHFEAVKDSREAEAEGLREELREEAAGYEEMLSAKNGWADRASSAEAFLHAQGYARDEDGTRRPKP